MHLEEFREEIATRLGTLRSMHDRASETINYLSTQGKTLELIQAMELLYKETGETLRIAREGWWNDPTKAYPLKLSSKTVEPAITKVEDPETLSRTVRYLLRAIRIQASAFHGVEVDNNAHGRLVVLKGLVDALNEINNMASNLDLTDLQP